MKEFILFINVTKQCNVNCHKCYLTEENRSLNQFLSNETLKQLCLAPEVKAAESVLVIFEGGEASLAGYDRLKSYSQVVREQLPNARQTMVTNLLVMPNWLINLCKEEYNSVFETTLALGGKYTLSGSESKYIEKFTKSLKKVADAGLECTVNIELNQQTIKAGPQAIIDIAEETGNKYWEFDLSVDFEYFLSNPTFNLNNYPLLSLQSSFDEVSKYLEAYIADYKTELKRLGLEITSLDYLQGKVDNLSFNIAKDMNFITLNPNGTVTTNPLFSDMPQTYLGNINKDAFSEILKAPGRRMRGRHERFRMSTCLPCPFYDVCGSGASHAPVIDGSGECVGFFNTRNKVMKLGLEHPLINEPGFIVK